MDDYLSRNPQSRVPVVFVKNQIIARRGDDWHLRNSISAQLFTRDLFDYQLPIDSDLYFFGRESLVLDYIDSVRKSQNRGLFGLRKIGKTSFLMKVRRKCEEDKIARILYYDCKLPSIRTLSWESLLWRIIEELTGSLPKINRHVSDVFIDTVKNLGNRKVCLIFDEIEYISPVSPFDDHWSDDFVPFWQTLWSAQSQHRNLSFIIAGVNGYVTEQDRFSGAQNPIFGIVRPFYLKGLDLNDLRQMARFFGRRMGLRFSDDAIDFLYGRYGGHPLLTRMACSSVHTQLIDLHGERPIEIDAKFLEQNADERDDEIFHYCRHIVSELKEFYPDEYELLTMLAMGSVGDFWEFSTEGDWVRHIRAYGLVNEDQSRPRFLIPALRKYISIEARRNTGDRLVLTVVPVVDRSSWVSSRIRRIIGDFRSLSNQIKRVSGDDLWLGGVLPEAERVNSIVPINNRSEFDSFIIILYRNFVEPVWKERKFRKVDKLDLDELYICLDRIRMLRHQAGHLNLNSNVATAVDTVIQEIVGSAGVMLEDAEYFAVQQFILDDLFVSIQVELQKFI